MNTLRKLTSKEAADLQGRLEILYGNLERTVRQCVQSGHDPERSREVGAYLPAVFHILLVFLERLLETGEIRLEPCRRVRRLQEPDLLLAMRCADSLLKYGALTVKAAKGSKGPNMSRQFWDPELAVNREIWEATGILSRSPDRWDAFTRLLLGRPLLGTLDPIVQGLLTGGPGSFEKTVQNSVASIRIGR